MNNIKNQDQQTNELVTLFSKGDYRKLINIAEDLIIKFPNNPNYYNLLALAYKKIGKRDKAEEVFFKIIRKNQKNPKIAFIYSNCANLFYDTGRTEKAIVFHKASLELDPGNLASSAGIGLALSSAGRDQEAINFLKKGLKKNNDDPKVNDIIAQSYRKIEKHRQAIEHYTKSNSRLSQSYKLECMYISIKTDSDKKNFHDFLDELNNSSFSDPLVSCISSHSSIRFSNSDNCNFCKKPFDYIKKNNLFNNNDFNENLIEQFLLDIKESGINQKAQALLNNGLQTSGNIFNLEYKSVKKMKEIIIDNIQSYRNSYKNSDSDFIKLWPKNFLIFGWLISLKKGGNLDPHMHKEGWLSSSIYLKLPNKNNDEGNIKFSLNGAGYETDGVDNYPEKIIDLSLGDMVMFPSSIFHSTIPFSSDENRITLAFDTIPQL